MARIVILSLGCAVLAAGVAVIQWLGPDPTILGFFGVGLLLVAFFLNLIGVLPAGGPAYLALNLAGAVLACLSSYLIGFMPFVLLEGSWAAVAFVGVARASLRATASAVADRQNR